MSFAPEGDKYGVGDQVKKVTGDYLFYGTVVAVFRKLKSDTIRYVVEDKRGLLMIMNEGQLEPHYGE